MLPKNSLTQAVRKIIILLLILFTFPVPTMVASATQGNPIQNPTDQTVILIEQLAKAGRNGDRLWKTFSPAQRAQIIKYLNLDDGKSQIVSLVIIPFDGQITKPTVGEIIEPQWWCGCYEIRNVAGPAAYNQVPAAAIAQAWGPGVLTLSTTKQVSNKWSANASVSAGVVSAGVGFDVTWSSSWTYSYQVTVPAGKLWEIDAYNLYHRYTYDVYYNPTIGNPYKVGTGWADEFKGVTYVIRKY